MHNIKDLFQGKTYEITKSKRTERGDLITQFTQRINETRTGNYKPFSVAQMSYLLSPFKIDELYLLWQNCEKAKNFTKFFWYFVNPKKK